MSKTLFFHLAVVLAVQTVFFPATAFTDDIVLKRGKIRGVVVKIENDVAHVNPYNSRNPRMTYGVETIPAARIKAVLPGKKPHQCYLRKLHALHPPGKKCSSEAEFELGELAEKYKFIDVAREHFLRALLLDSGHAGARSRFDAYQLKRIQKADPRFNQELAGEIKKWFSIKELKERRAKLKKLQSQYGFSKDLLYMERVRRSLSQPRGRHDDIPLSLNAREDKGIYSLYVPKNYDPMRPWPLVVGLHGGGPDGKDGKDVVGSGRSAMNFYVSGAGRFGYIVVCPNAVRAPWRNRMNDSLLNSVLEEVCLLYNVDLNRVYLTGHSLGGFGTWHYGPKYAHRWAAVAPMAGGGFNGLNTLRKTRTPVYLYHGANDSVVSCGNSRLAAEGLRKANDDFIYTEIPDSGHGFPPDVAEEMWAFFHQRRLAVTPRRTRSGKFRVVLTPYSSFFQPVSREERLYFGASGEEASTDKKALLARLKLGGGAATEAARALISLGDRTVVKPLGVVACNRKRGDDVRRAAVLVLGELGAPETSRILHRALRTASLDLVADVAVALGKVKDPESVKPLCRSLVHITREFQHRLLAGTHMAFSDWRRCLGAYTAVAGVLGELGDPAAFGALERVTGKVLLEDWNPRSSRRAGLKPKLLLGRCVCAFIEAFGRIGDKRGLQCIQRLEHKHGGLGGVGQAAARARMKLEQG